MNKVYLTIAFICVFFIGLTVGALVWQKPTVGAHTSYKKGTEQKELKQGEEHVTVTTVRESGRDTKSPEAREGEALSSDSSCMHYSFSGSDSARYDLSATVTTWPAVDSAKLTYKLTFDRVEKTRVDTLFITRVDTLTYTQVVEKPRPFYDNFWTGAASTAIAFAAVAILL